jgi:hypothetical protein
MNRDFHGIAFSTILLEATRSAIDTATISHRLSADTVIRRTPAFENLLTQFSLTPQESFIAYRVEGNGTSIEMLGILTAFPEEQILRFVFLLERIGAVELIARKARAD